MFSFFQKKYFLTDYLHGLIDIHCHLLPGIDDGSKDDEMSLEMISEYQSIGYKGAIATPHVMEGLYGNNSTKIQEYTNRIKQTIKSANIEGFSIEGAAEYMLDKEFDSLIATKDLLPLFSNYVLVEMSYLQKSVFVDSQLFNLQHNGFLPILAHPERYLYLNSKEEVLEFKNRGSLLQLNLLSLSSHYGARVNGKALELLNADQYDFIGTDAHSPRHLRALKNITLPKKHVGNLENLIERMKEKLDIF